MNPLRYADMFIGISVGMLAVVSLVESQVAALKWSALWQASRHSLRCEWTALWERFKQRLWLRVDGSGCEWTALWKRVEQRLWLQVDGSSEESQKIALVASGQLFGRESNSGSCQQI